MEAQQSSSRLGGPFSRSLSAVMECINIGEPAGPSTNGSMYIPRPGASCAHPVRFSTTAARRTGIRVPWDGIFVQNRRRIPGPHALISKRERERNRGSERAREGERTGVEELVWSTYALPVASRIHALHRRLPEALHGQPFYHSSQV